MSLDTIVCEYDYLHVSFADSFIRRREYEVREKNEQEALHFNNRETHPDASLQKEVRIHVS